MLSLVVHLADICCYSLWFVVTRCHSVSLSVSLVSLSSEIKLMKSINSFYKNLHFRYSTGFCIMPLEFLYSLTWNKYLVSGVVIRKIDGLKNVAEFTGKFLRWSPSFKKVAGCLPASLLGKELRHRCFPVNFAKYVRNPSFRTPPMAKNKTIYLPLW